MDRENKSIFGEGGALFAYWSKVIQKAIDAGKSDVVLDVRGTGVTLSDLYTSVGVLVSAGFRVRRMVDTSGKLLFLAEWGDDDDD